MLVKCPDCEEINLWSYWQGGIDHLDADILLVGQDWGNFDVIECDTLMEAIRAHNKDKSSVFDYLKDNDNPTDMNLCNLFASIGENIGPKPINNTNVFFTNFVLCYRTANNSISGGFRQKWAANCAPYFSRLVQIVEPKVIICLGRAVFYNVLKTAGEKLPHKKYNDIIALGAHKVCFGQHECKVFPVAHCGVLGTNNRNKGLAIQDKLDIQITDWQKIKSALETAL